ncbi:MAG: magnesium transporter [Candidatus Baldrarchaeia archaeon]
MKDKGGRNVALFSSTFPQALFALSFGTLDLVAGFIASLVASYVVKMPWILIIYPPLLTVRGNISGMFSGRLTTGLHVGLIKPNIRKNTEYFYSLRASIFSMSFINALIVGVLTYIVFLIFEPLYYVSLLILIFIAVMSMMIPTTISIFFLAPLVAIVSYKKGIDPDVIAYPILSTVNDIIVSVVYVITIWLFIFWGNVFITVSYILIILFSFIFIYSSKYWTDKNFKKTFSEGMFILMVLMIISNFTGGVLSKLRYYIERYPHILAIYPCLLTMIGDEGSIIASITTTKLGLGNIKPSLKSIVYRENAIPIFGVLLAGLIMSTIFATLGSFLYAFSVLKLVQTILVSFVTVILLAIPIILVSFGSAIITFKRGLNPDNFTIPTITSLSDFLTTISLFTVIRLIMGI